MKHERPAPQGEWRITQIADAIDVTEGRSDKPCFRIHGPEGIEGVIWTWNTAKQALAEFTLAVYGIYPSAVTTEKFYT